MHHLFDLKNKNILIVGATSAIAQAISDVFIEHHANLIWVDLFQDKLIQVREQLNLSHSSQVSIYPCLFSDPKSREIVINEILNVHQHIDIFIYAAGVQGPAGSSLAISDQDIQKVLNVNLLAPMHFAQLLIPQMQNRKYGSLIFISSIASVRGNQNIGLYGTSKAGLCQFARNLAVEFGPDNIRANTISPGLIKTPFAENLINNEFFMQQRLAKTPLRRVGEPSEIAATALLLACDGGAFISGQNIIVDGGTTISD